LPDCTARALRPAHAPMDGDAVFAAATGSVRHVPTLREKTEIGHCAADCLARAIARAVYEATPLTYPGALPSWRGKLEGG
jgi:L-aminopeptidase/D-esterase-like protein